MKLFISILIILLTTVSCNRAKKERLIVFHAGSLSVPFAVISEEFQKEYPEIRVYREQSGSLAAARKITELKKECDILALADYLIIDNIMIPDYAEWNYIFATNEMIIAYNEKSAYSDIINSENWHEIILKDNVGIGRSEPNLDPCGYRTLFVFMLAEKYYNINGLSEKLKNIKNTVIRPKETDLLAILETGNIDYLFIYKSVAIQHNLSYIELPDEINLSNPAMDNLYRTVSTIVDGANIGEKIEIYGSSILYGFTIPKNHQNYDAAIKFANFLTNQEKGGKIIEEQGMTPLQFYKEEFSAIIPNEIITNIKKE